MEVGVEDASRTLTLETSALLQAGPSNRKRCASRPFCAPRRTRPAAFLRLRAAEIFGIVLACPGLGAVGHMTMTDKRNLVAQWAFDTRPVLLRFHLWLEDVEVERAQAEPVSAHTLHAPRHRALPRDDLGGHRARDAALRRLRRGGGQGQGDATTR